MNIFDDIDIDLENEDDIYGNDQDQIYKSLSKSSLNELDLMIEQEKIKENQIIESNHTILDQELEKENHI